MLKAATPLPPIEFDPQAIRAAHRPARRAWPRVLAPACIAVVVIAIAAVTFAVTAGPHSKSGRLSAQSPKPTAATANTAEGTYAGLTLRYPSSWHAIPVTFLNGGLEYPLGYITNEPTLNECRPRTSTAISCGPPIDTLTSGGVMVIIGSEPRISQHAEPNATLGGLPATVNESDGASCGVSGATYGKLAVIYLPTGGSSSGTDLTISACAAAVASDPVNADIAQMFDTATFAGATTQPCRILVTVNGVTTTVAERVPVPTIHARVPASISAYLADCDGRPGSFVLARARTRLTPSGANAWSVRQPAQLKLTGTAAMCSPKEKQCVGGIASLGTVTISITN
jgi:hypothetical protein